MGNPAPKSRHGRLAHWRNCISGNSEGVVSLSMDVLPDLGGRDSFLRFVGLGGELTRNNFSAQSSLQVFGHFKALSALDALDMDLNLALFVDHNLNFVDLHNLFCVADCFFFFWSIIQLGAGSPRPAQQQVDTPFLLPLLSQ